MTIVRWCGLVGGLTIGGLGAVACGETESGDFPTQDSGVGDISTGDASTRPTPDAEPAPAPAEDAAVPDSGAGDSGTDDSGTDDGGTDAGHAPTGCKAAHDANPGATDGLYTIDPDGDGPQPAIEVFCDMTTDGGGWTLGLLRNSVDEGSYPTFASGYVNVAALAIDPKVASSTDAATPAVAGWLDLNVLSYTELVLEGFDKGASTFRSEPIAKSTLRIPFGQSGYYLYDDTNGYFWCGGAKAYTDDGVGQVNQPTGAPADCKGHTSLGDGWDFGGAGWNTNLTACGGGSSLMKAGPTAGMRSYPNPGSAHAFWVR